MKTLLLISIGFWAFIKLSAQQFYFSANNWELNNFHLLNEKTITDLNISQLKVYRKANNKSLKPLLISVYEFNSFGKTISYVEYTKPDKISLSYTSRYNNDSLLIEFHQNGSKKYQNFKTIYEYNENKMPVVIKKYKKNRLTPAYTSYNYYDGKKLTKQEIFNNGKLKRFYIYSYYPDGSNEKTQTFSNKGKLVKTITYACKPEGEISKPAKDTVRICKYEKYDNTGKIYKITETTDEKNNIIKHVNIFNSDTVLIESKSYKKDTILNYRAIYLVVADKKNYPPIISERYYYHKGRPQYVYKNVYDDQLRQISSENIIFKGSKSKVIHSKTNEFDDKGLLVKCNNSSSKNKLYEFTYEYLFKK